MNLTELHQAAVEAAEELRKAQAVTDAERASSENGVASKATRQTEKAARKVYDSAMSAFQNAIDELEIEDRPANLAEMYQQIGKVRI